MKIALGIMLIVLVIIMIVTYFQLWRYVKLHAQEELELHKKYILTRLILIAVMGMISGCIGLVSLILRYCT